MLPLTEPGQTQGDDGAEEDDGALDTYGNIVRERVTRLVKY